MKDSSNQNKNCCENEKKSKNTSLRSGIVYGLTPHIGCIAFIVFSVLGVTTATTLFKPLLLNPYFFYILIALSLVFATISAFLYFKKHGIFLYQKTKEGTSLSFSLKGIKGSWKYLFTLYGTTILTNLFLFMVIFPLTANLISGSPATVLAATQSSLTLQVNIPCPGHAPPITEELKKIDGVSSVKFRFPNLFDVSYDPAKTTEQKILSPEVFKTYKATIVGEGLNETKTLQQTNSNGNEFVGGCGSGCKGCGSSCGCGGR